MGAFEDQLRHQVEQLRRALRAAEDGLQRRRQADATAPVLLGWWCWRCEGFNKQACRSDSVPVYVPAEWLQDMRKTLVTDKEENE